MLDIFTFTEVNGKDKEYQPVELNKTYLRLIPEFKTLLERRLTTSDHDHRFKVTHFKIFTYLFLYYDYDSPYANLEDGKRKIYASRDCGLGDEIKEYLKIDYVKDAINKYIELQSIMPEIELLCELKRGMSMSARAVRFYNQQLSQVLDLTESMIEDKDKNLQEKNEQIATLQLNMKGLQSTVLDLPKQIKAVEEMMNVISKKEETETTGRGGHEVHHREQVKSDTRKN